MTGLSNKECLLLDRRTLFYHCYSSVTLQTSKVSETLEVFITLSSNKNPLSQPIKAPSQKK